jgi:hypothetical protein
LAIFPDAVSGEAARLPTQNSPGPAPKILYDTTNAQLRFGIGRLQDALQKAGYTHTPAPRDTVIVRILPPQALPTVRREGYQHRYQGFKLMIEATDTSGAMYGALDAAEQVRMGKSWKLLPPKRQNPHLAVRALKINLPWSSYRTGPAMEMHMATCKDPAFWQKLLDQMAENRFNVLSLWNVHPFSFIVRPANFPLANAFTDQEMAQWKQLFTSIFRMARERGIEPYIVNWNIAVSPEFAAHYGVKERNDTSAIVKQYTREVVTQVINEYPDLAGIGVTLADWMSNFRAADSPLPIMSSKDREDWIEETVVAGIKAANRPVKFLHRSVLSADPIEMKRVIDATSLPDTTLVEIKFNWSHGHSTPTLALTHDSHSGQRDDRYWNPLPTNYRVQWMVRNEDFFILRWGQPDFIRSHIMQNTAPHVNGYFVGSEGYIPALEFSHVPSEHQTWQYAFEKQWLFYALWGRLLYDPLTPNEVFAAKFNDRYPYSPGQSLLRAYTAASNMPLRLASFYRSTWDYTLYSEGFLAPFSAISGGQDTVSSFISINELIAHPTLDPAFLSIESYVELMLTQQPIAEGLMTPQALADSLSIDGQRVLDLVQPLKKTAPPTLACELTDLETWAYLSLYFADKLRAGIALQAYRISNNKGWQKKALALLSDCVKHWKELSKLTAAHYHEVPYLQGYTSQENAYRDARYFSWAAFLPQVERDIELAKEVNKTNY